MLTNLIERFYPQIISNRVVKKLSMLFILWVDVDMWMYPHTFKELLWNSLLLDLDVLRRIFAHDKLL